MRFINRADAGRQLAAVLRRRGPTDPVVLGVVRGGVPVAAELARALRAPFDICVVRNVIVNGEPPAVVGAVAEHAAAYLDPTRVSHFGLTYDELDRMVAHELEEVDRLSSLLRDGPAIDLTGRHVILVDDGVLTGTTIRAAIRSVRRRASTIELAVPVGSTEEIERLRPFVDGLHCLVSDHALVAVGARYDSFEPVSEAEVSSLLTASTSYSRRKPMRDGRPDESRAR
jgi:putative phosphoribosyl transferase